MRQIKATNRRMVREEVEGPEQRGETNRKLDLLDFSGLPLIEVVHVVCFPASRGMLSSRQSGKMRILQPENSRLAFDRPG